MTSVAAGPAIWVLHNYKNYRKEYFMKRFDLFGGGATI